MSTGIHRVPIVGLGYAGAIPSLRCAFDFMQSHLGIVATFLDPDNLQTVGFDRRDGKLRIVLRTDVRDPAAR